MAIVWGAWAPNSTTTKRIRLGLELTYSGTPSTGSVTVTKKLYAECYYRIDDSVNTTNITGVGGAFSGSRDYDFPSNYSQILVWQGTSVETVVYGSTTTKTAAASVTGIEYIGSSYKATVSASIVLPARPIAIPAAPAIGTNTRNSDYSNSITWTNNSTVAAPYTQIAVDRSANGGSWVQVASLSGSATAYTDNTTQPNNSYAYRVRAVNSAGSAASASSSTTYNTPAAPTGVAAVKAGATEVVLSWTDAALTEDGYEIGESVDGGATWAATGTASANATGYTDASAPSGTVVYRVRAKRGTLYSAWVQSNAVTTLQAPAAPTLVPWAAYSPVGTTLRVSWQHNPLDGSAQTSAEVVYTRNGASTTVTVSGATSYYDIPVSGYAAGSTITAKVRTKGLYADYGPYSATQSTMLAQAPGVAITFPAVNGAVVADVPLYVTWSYTDAYAQAGWTLSLYGAAGLVRSWSGTTQREQAITIENLADGSAYTLTLTVRSGSGFTSSATRTFTTQFAAPTAPLVFAQWRSDTLSAEVTGFAGATGSLPPTHHLSLLRIETFDGIEETTLIADGLATGSAFIDATPRLGQTVVYRLMAVAANGAASTAEATVATRADGRYAVNFGTGLLVLKWDRSASHDSSDDSELLTFAGRPLPVVYAGEHVSESISLQAVGLTPDVPASVRALRAWPRSAVYREPRGYRAAVKVTAVSDSTTDRQGHTAVALSMRVVSE